MAKARIFGIVLILLGLAVSASTYLKSESFTPDLGLKWNLEHMEVVLKDTVEQDYMDVARFREKFPAYADMDDLELSERLRVKYFSGMKLDEYREVFLTSKTGTKGEADGDPLQIRGDIDDFRVSDMLSRAVLTADAIQYGLVSLNHMRVAFPYRYALFAGLGLMAFGLVVLALSRKKRYNGKQTISD